MLRWNIPPLPASLDEALWGRIHGKTKPLGSLGRLETLAFQLGRIQQSLRPELKNPTFLVFAGDHGIAESGVSSYPQEVTTQMVLNFLAGGAAINVFCRQHELKLQVVDAGVKGDLPDHPDLRRCKVRPGTRNFLHDPAMTSAELEEALRHGVAVVEECSRSGSNLLGFGEMGIGNTSSAAALMQRLSGLPLECCVGRGTGLDDTGLKHKHAVLESALERHPEVADPWEVLRTFGGLEIAMMSGAMLQAAQRGMVLLVDGFIATVAFLVAVQVQPRIQEYAVFAHQSEEQGHRRLLEFLQAEPLLHLGMRLGEGSGAAVAFPLLQSAAAFLSEMASFESAGVSERSDA
jgi:nicotinate-nucleotide--dimethylbenzimidazole phosphoribosyltransferase